MNKDEYGIVFRLGVGFDLSANTALSLTFTKPDATELTVANPSVTSPTIVGGEFLADEYFAYTFASGDVDQSGTWSVRGTYDDGTQHLISDEATFLVGD
jgi:hypothetical protein